MICTFFGHRDCYELEGKVLERAIEELIAKGVKQFYAGNQGHFDSMVFSCMTALKEKYPYISFSVVLAYMPTQKGKDNIYSGCSVYPEGIESGAARFAIERRNRWMIERATYCLCYINHTWGGAYKFVCQAKRRGVTVINLGSAEV